MKGLGLLLWCLCPFTCGADADINGDEEEAAVRGAAEASGWEGLATG